MKNKIIALLMLSVLLLTNCFNVYAEGEQNVFTHDGYKYSIEGFRLKVYEMQLEKDEDGEYVSNEESSYKLIFDIPSHIIEIPTDQITYTPTYHNEKIQGTNVTMINLSTSLTEAKLKTLLAGELADTSETKGYLVNLVVDYKILEAPSKYTKIQTQNYLIDSAREEYLEEHPGGLQKVVNPANEDTPKDGDGIDSINTIPPVEEIENEETNVELLLPVKAEEIQIGSVSEQIINTFGLRKDKADTGFTMNSDKATIEFSLATTTFTNDNAESLIIMFTNIDDTAKLAANFTELLNKVSEDPYTGTTVKVDDTAMDVPKALWIGGFVSMVLGASVIFFVTKKQGMRA